jgi:Fur family transcriptional regulator, ferric uptake regulator
MGTIKKSIPSGEKFLPCGRKIVSSQFSDRESERKKLEKWQFELKSYLEKNGLKYSEQRWKIAKLILEKRGHFNAQEIVREVVGAYPGIGPATVYRNLKVLCEAKILKETLVDVEGVIIYEPYEEHHHDHLVCLDCNEIFEFHHANIEALQQEVANQMKFKEVRHRHVIYARCQFKAERGQPEEISNIREKSRKAY